MIRIQDIFFTYQNGHRGSQVVLNGLSLTIEPGESIAIMGPNGSGKTTFARCLNGLLIPDRGTITVDGYDSRNDRDIMEIRRRVGMVFQNPDNQIVSATVEREIAFGLENLGIPHDRMHRVTDEMLRRFHIEKYRQKSPHYLSGGEKQKLALAAVLAMEPKYLVLDEPTSLLDPMSRKEILNNLKELHSSIESKDRGQPIATMLITQFSEEALSSDRVLIFHRGQIIMDDTPARVFGRTGELDQIGLSPPVSFTLEKVFAGSGNL